MNKVERKGKWWFLLITLVIVVESVCQDIVDEIKRAQDGSSYVYEGTISKLFTRKYEEWIAVVKKLKSEEELKFRKEGQKLQDIINKRLYLYRIIPQQNRAKYQEELLALIIYVEKKHLQILTNINNIVSDEKNPFYIWELVLYEIRGEVKKGRKINDKFIVEIILLLIDRYYLIDKMKWVREFIRYGDEDIRKSALDVISKFSYEEAIEEVTTCLLDNSPVIRSYALTVLARLYAVEKKAYILKALEDKNPLVRISAIRAARRLGIQDPKSLEEIIKYLRDENIDVVIEVLLTIRYLNLYKYADEVFDIVKNIEIPDSALEPEKFNNVVHLINEVIVTLTYLNYKNPLFKKFLFKKIIASNEPRLIKFALKAIGYLKFGSKEIVTDIVKILDSPAGDKEIQASALYTLGYMKQKDIIKEYVLKRIEDMEYSELESFFEISKNAYSPLLINALSREYKKKKAKDEDKVYIKKVNIIQILTQFTYSEKVKNVLFDLMNRESDVRLINLIAEGLSRFKLKKKDYAFLYKIYRKELEDREGYLPICRRNIAKLISKIPKYFSELFKDYDEMEPISHRRISYLEALEQNKQYLNEEAKKRIIDIIFNSKNEKGYDYSPQIFRAVCTIIYTGIDKVIDDKVEEELIKLIEKFKDNSKYSSAVLASKLILLLKGNKNFLDSFFEILDIKDFYQINEYLNLINKKDFLSDFQKIKFKEELLSGPLYLVFNTLNKMIEQKSGYSLNYLNLPDETLNKYMLIKIKRGDNLFTLLQYIKDVVGDFTYIIHNNTIVLYTLEDASQQWISWYYRNYKKE
ncbi:MAG: HEAT repeat domain-containing protein [Planctomycetota bacterium]